MECHNVFGLFSLLVTVLCLYSTTAAYIVDIASSVERLTCWTCPNKIDNTDCNNWAPDIYCPLNHTVCQTTHTIDIETGKSVGVDKRCALPTGCGEKSVGCTVQDDGHIVCVSCCNDSYCNEEVPNNHTMAYRLSSVFNGSPVCGSHRNFIALTGILSVVLLSFV